MRHITGKKVEPARSSDDDSDTASDFNNEDDLSDDASSRRSGRPVGSVVVERSRDNTNTNTDTGRSTLRDGFVPDRGLTILEDDDSDESDSADFGRGVGRDGLGGGDGGVARGIDFWNWFDFSCQWLPPDNCGSTPLPSRNTNDID